MQFPKESETLPDNWRYIPEKYRGEVAVIKIHMKDGSFRHATRIWAIGSPADNRGMNATIYAQYAIYPGKAILAKDIERMELVVEPANAPAHKESME